MFTHLQYASADVNRKCWCVTSKGMHAVGQVEVVVLLQCVPEEKSFPRDIFSHLLQLYTDALTGWTWCSVVLLLSLELSCKLRFTHLVLSPYLPVSSPQARC